MPLLDLHTSPSPKLQQLSTLRFSSRRSLKSSRSWEVATLQFRLLRPPFVLDPASHVLVIALLFLIKNVERRGDDIACLTPRFDKVGRPWLVFRSILSLLQDSLCAEFQPCDLPGSPCSASTRSSLISVSRSRCSREESAG